MKDINNKTQIHTERSKKVHTGPFCFLIWIFKVEIIILAIYFIINSISTLVSDKTKFIIKYNLENAFYKDINSGEYSTKNIFEELDKNNNLNIEEKEFIKENLYNEIAENIKYIDTSKISKRLRKLDTSYHKKYVYNEKVSKYELKNEDIYLRKIGGNYNSIFNEINIYEQKDDKITENYQNEVFDFDLCDKRVYFHELNHLLTKNTVFTLIDTLTMNLEQTRKSSKIADKEIFLESINEIFSLEYMADNYENSFDQNLVYAYVLIEILPEDVIRKYKFYDNQSILISGLLEIDDNIDEVYKLFYSINKACQKQGTENDYKNIHDGFTYFYERKYNKNMSEDLEILLYFYGTDTQTNEERSFIRDILKLEEHDEILKVLPKGYFSKEYKDRHKGVFIEYSQNGDIKTSNL